MLSTLSTLLLATLLTPPTTANFFISNTSVCMGAFIVQNCFVGAKVLSGVDNKTDYTCSHLVSAQDNHFIQNGTAGPTGDDHLIVDGGICDSGKLKLLKDGEGYVVMNEGGENVGDCRRDNSTTKVCNMWVGMLGFQSMYQCTSSICG